MNIYKIHCHCTFCMSCVGATTLIQIHNVYAVMFLHTSTSQVHEQRLKMCSSVGMVFLKETQWYFDKTHLANRATWKCQKLVLNFTDSNRQVFKSHSGPKWSPHLPFPFLIFLMRNKNSGNFFFSIFFIILFLLESSLWSQVIPVQGCQFVS